MVGRVTEVSDDSVLDSDFDVDGAADLEGDVDLDGDGDLDVAGDGETDGVATICVMKLIQAFLNMPLTTR